METSYFKAPSYFKIMYLLPICIVLNAYAAEPDAAFTLSPGIVVNAARSQIFYSDVNTRLQSRAVADGALRWQSEERGLPLGLIDSALLVLTQPERNGQARLAWVNAKTGALLERITAPLPEDVLAGVGPQSNQQFEITTTLDGKRLQLHWQYHYRPLRGALLEEDIAGTKEISRNGVFSISADATNAVTLDARTVMAPPRLVYALDSTQALSDVAGRQFRSTDARNVLASVAVDDAEFGSRYRWSVLDQAGLKLGEINAIQSMAPFFVSNAVLVVRTGAVFSKRADGSYSQLGERLVGYELSTALSGGTELWSAPVLDSVYRGVVPP